MVDFQGIVNLVYLTALCAVFSILAVFVWWWRGQGFEAFDVVCLMVAAGCWFVPVAYAKVALGVKYH